MTDKPKFDQREQDVQGPQTNIPGSVNAPVLSGQFHGPVSLSGLTSPIIPHQIPPPPADFKGREKEISDIISTSIGAQPSLAYAAWVESARVLSHL